MGPSPKIRLNRPLILWIIPCKAGFNAGHSSFNFLTARRDVVVQSFDVGRHRYVSPMVSFLRRTFPGRLSVELGDSRLTVPRHFRPDSGSTGPGVGCDLMLVDGGHGFDVALSDIRNFARVASRPRNVIVVDDTNRRQVRTAWKVAVRSGIVQQLFTCRFGSNGRAFALGVVRPQNSHSRWSNAPFPVNVRFHQRMLRP